MSRSYLNMAPYNPDYALACIILASGRFTQILTYDCSRSALVHYISNAEFGLNHCSDFLYTKMFCHKGLEMAWRMLMRGFWNGMLYFWNHAFYFSKQLFVIWKRMFWFRKLMFEIWRRMFCFKTLMLRQRLKIRHFGFLCSLQRGLCIAFRALCTAKRTLCLSW